MKTIRPPLRLLSCMLSPWLVAAALLAGSAALALAPLFPLVSEARAAETATAAKAKASTTADTRADVVKRGEYLARAGDCVACHTAPRGKLFAGGLAMETPFGTLYSPNITPDAQYGIGTWSEDAFFRMMRTGRTPEGTLLYPAMPIAQYTKVTRDDSDAIFAYLKSIAPVREPNRKHTLRFPFNQRNLLYGWRTLYFHEGEFKPDPTRSVEWNRGAYLVEGLGHCTMCHTKINMLGGSSQSEQFAGGLIPVQNWYAPSLTSDKDGGLGDWSIKDIVDLLRAGISDRGAVYGPMAEVTYHSLQYMTDEDVKAMAVYLKTLPDNRGRKTGPTAATDTNVYAPGEKIYADKCALCHGAKGEGKLQHYPPLAGNQSIEMDSAVNPIRIVLNGGFPPGTMRNPEPYGMPPFGQELNDTDAAAVVTYIRTAWGNHGKPVTAREVNELRNAPLH
ncbi:c-type cytochrome [Paraburkholderia rhynchosiae]|uniref:Alcohol dehydrogenase n=1 Tax=Paraburkholderia rhynchosiae TaxID=487049 RepID=A0A2N7VW44_9BURK|nr:cytochrome c [Paraburkholderia rhynchosiae]PMS21361.1 alcohol dehydrogenase [Paraburkholderia rhynchosiae]CAB3740828.1 Alcohol dehydrogenase (quinone), cytochrome c subunit [Paraburkholderia rhynchosiae]